MKLLIVAQAVDTEDLPLGFFVRWVAELAKHFEHIDVICLKEGKYDLPANVRVHSLGKEKGVSRVKYIFNFYTHIWRLRNEYDAVFVHMNEEYVLLGGWVWKLLGKRVYLWRNHYAGSWLTNLAASFCTKVFCTSKHSYTAKYKKTVLMPVGVDAERFAHESNVIRTSNSILSLARMAPSKRPELLIHALAMLARDGVAFSASFVGSPVSKDEPYYQSLQEKVAALGLIGQIHFSSGVPQDEAPDLFHAHEIFVNNSPSGMLDKTTFEAIASGCLPVFASADMAVIAGAEYVYTDGDADELAKRLKTLLALPRAERDARVREVQARAIPPHSLATLGEKIAEEIV